MNVVLLTALGIVFPAQAQLTGAQDTGSIEQQMGRMIDLLDSHVYEQTVSWDEHVVLCYGLAHGREPAPEELLLLRGYREDLGIAHSTALSFVLRGRMPALTWATCLDFLGRVEPSDFRVDQEVRRP